MPAAKLIVGAFLAALAASPALADPAYIRLTPETLGDLARQGKPPTKPGMSPSAGADTCRWANDFECDEPDIGTGACALHTDYSDCRYLREGETDTCEWARDGECDEPGLGTGVCVQGTDRTDCAGVVHLRFRDDSCETAYNGVCEERDTSLRDGPPVCAPRTDRADCVGRKRPMTINDHFQGYDDRVLLRTDAYPWTAIGQIDFDAGTSCTGTLVAADVVLTAAHCIHDEDGRVDAAGVFRGGQDRPGGASEAHVVAYFAAPRFNPEMFDSSNKLDGTDWAYLRLDQPLGDELGTIAITPVVTLADIHELVQAGYSWDTGERLSGNIGCAPVALNADATLEHACDTTQGDSGSPLMVVRDGVYGIVAVDSKFRAHPGEPAINIAARALGFARYLDDVASGEVGEPVTPARPSKLTHSAE